MVAYDLDSRTIQTRSDSDVLSLTNTRTRQQSEKDADCRTRTYVSYHRSTRSGSVQGVGTESLLRRSPSRIFEHRRSLGEDSNGDSKGHATRGYSPSSFAEIERWLDEKVESALNSSLGGTDLSGSVNILFLDEKKCMAAFGDDFDLAKLHSRLKINDWSTAHYQSTFCRFPLPLEVGAKDEKRSKNYDWDWRYSISHPFDWDMLWVYFPSTRTSVGIVRTWFEGYDTDFLEMESLITSFAGPIMSHPMILGLFALQILTRDTMLNIREKGNRVFEAQKRTGFHTYDRLRSTEIGADNEGAIDLSAITKDILGAASNMTGWENASQQLIGFAKFIMMENERFSTSCFAPKDDYRYERLRLYVDQQSQKLIGDLDGAHSDARAWLATATFLMQGVLNLISQRDATVNIELARDSKNMAEQSRRDSMSMTSIATLTMFFLPGTFTASFFAMPFFDSAISDNGPAKFWIYWAVTLPLMFGVFTAWVIWMRYVRRPGKLLHSHP